MWKKCFVAAFACGLCGIAPAQKIPVLLTLDAAQQAALGIHTARLQAAAADLLLASAQVRVPPGRDVTVTASYPGQITRLLAGIGDTVNVGSGLAHFTSPHLGEARRQRDEARLNAQTAQAAWQRDRVMFDEGLIPAVRLQLSQSHHAAAQAMLQAREAELLAVGVRFGNAAADYATGVLLAPIRGVVADSFSTVGQRVEAGTVLFRLVDERELQLDLQLSPDKAARVRVGDAVSLPERQARAQITGVSPALQAGQMVRARARVLERGTLRLGEALSVSIQASGIRTDKTPVWRVPTRALSYWRGQPMLFVMQEKGFRVEPVQVLSSDDDGAVVRGATLTEGQAIASRGVAALHGLLQKDE